MQVVGSVDAHGMRYSAVFSVQTHRMERHIMYMDELIEQLLDNYYQCTGHKPKHVVYFRDGVGEQGYG